MGNRDAEKKLRLAGSILESEKYHRIDLLRKESGVDRETFDKTLSDLSEAGVIELTGGDPSETDFDDLFRPEGVSEPFVNLVWQKDPVRFLFVFRSECLDAYERAGKSPKKAFSFLCDSLPALGQEMTFNTFRQYITPLYKLSGLFEDKAGHDDMLAELQAENDALRAKLAEEKKEHQGELEALRAMRTAQEKKAEMLRAENERLTAEIKAGVSENERIGNEKERLEEKKGNMDTQNRIERRLEAMAAKIEQLSSVVERLEKAEPAPVGKTDHLIPHEKPLPKKKKRKIGGWTVNTNKRGYFFASRRIDGKTKGFYLGGDESRIESVFMVKFAEAKKENPALPFE